MPNAPIYSLAPFKQKLQQAELLHLLRRCLFGVGHKEVSFFKGKELGECMDILLKQSPPAPVLVQPETNILDPMVPVGHEWINAPFETDVIDTNRGLQLKMNWVGRIMNRDYSLTEKMTLFWHNHFVTEMDVVKDSRYSYRYITMLRAHSLGNFKKLIREGTTNMAMLVYLNGNSNSKEAPNENYSRELMELFTLGKAGPVNYTEDDVKSGARVLSGWRDDKDKLEVSFHPALHDAEDKQFSSFFSGKVIKGKKGADGAGETDELIEIIFAKEDTANFVCRNLYRWFVSAHIDENIERQIIAPLGKILQANNFEVVPVLRTLLSSEHFFDPAFRGCMVKSPVDFFLGVMQQFDIASSFSAYQNELSWLQYYFYLEDLTMGIGNPPSVAGWPAYYQAPKYYQWWINSATLGFRSKLMERFSSPEGVICNGPYMKFDFVPFVQQCENPADADKLIENCMDLLFAAKIGDASKQKLKSLLAGKNGESNWADTWNKFSAEPNDAASRKVIETKLRPFFVHMMNMPEFQMM